MRVNAKVKDLIYGNGVVTAVNDNVIEVYFKDKSEVKYFENKNNQLYLIIQSGIAENPTASFSRNVYLQEEEISFNGKGTKTRGITFKRVNSNSRSFKIVQTLIDENLSKKEILNKMNIDMQGKSLGGYLSNIFAALSDADIIKFDRKSKTWIKGSQYDYFMFVVAQR